MAKKELTSLEHNNSVWAEIKVLTDKVEGLKSTLNPATLPKQATLNDCNRLARAAKVKVNTTDPKRLSTERVVIKPA